MKYMGNINDIQKIKDLNNFVNEFERNQKTYKQLLPNAKYKKALIDVRKTKELIKLSSTYNDLFSEHGWIVHESLESQEIKEVIRIYNSNDFESAEKYIMQIYEGKLENRLKVATSVMPLYSRRRLIDLAVLDFQERRYHACIPVILMLVDGVVNDIQDSGLFSQNIELEVWDSISGHSEGLSKVVAIYNKGRKKTTNEPLTLPYRNGIMHGRDLNYDNKKVALKSFALIFYLSDWIRAYASEDLRKEKYLQETSFTFDDVIKHKEKMEEHRQLQKKWKKREKIIIEEPDLEIYGINTPEGTAITFFRYIMVNNFGNPADFFSDNLFGDLSKQTRISRLKETFKNRSIETIDKVSCIDIGTANSKVKVELTYSSDLYLNRKETVTLNLNYELNGGIENRLKKGGKWTIINILGIADLLI